MTAKDLKNALLQEAVQGKLVPQIASEGNARDLLEEIGKERLSHGFANSYGICDGKNKKSKSSDLRSKSQIRVTKKELPEIAEDEIPFEIPESWCWCKLGELTEIITKGSSPSWQGINYVDKGILFVTSENVGDEELLLSKRKFLEQKFNEIQPRSILQKGDILTNIVGASIGRTAIFDLDIKNANINQAVALIRLKNKQLNSYIVKVLNSKTIIDQMTDNTVNTARANISLTTVENFKIPLPPLAEQKRIVSAVEKFMPLIEEYGKKETELKALNEQIGTPTKKAILQEAVQGKLVPQIAAEGNAKDLLEKIKKEKAKLIKEGKIKKEKTLPEITDDEIPFDIPENWCWCRLGEIVYNNGQKTPDKEFSYIDIGSIDNEHQKLNEKENFIQPENAPSRARKIVKKGDIIYSTVRPYLHNMCIIDKDFEKEPIASTGFAVLACYPQINNQYLFYYLLSPSFDNYANDTENSKGVAYPAINDDRLYKGIVPLPPLEEQKRIVAAIEKILPLCEKLGE